MSDERALHHEAPDQDWQGGPHPIREWLMHHLGQDIVSSAMDAEVEAHYQDWKKRQEEMKGDRREAE